MQIAPSVGSASHALSCWSGMATCKPRASPSVKQPRCLTCLAAPCRPGGRTVTAGAPLWARAERIRTLLFAPGGACQALAPGEQDRLQQKAATLADVFQRSSANVEGRNGSLSRRNHQLRGLDYPRKRACLTAVHNFFLTRADGTTAAERFFGQRPRSMFATIWAAVELPPAPLNPPRRAVG